MDPGYVFARHHRKLIEALQRVADGECTRLMIFMPPRHGKSRTSSELFPAYYLGRNPDHRIIGTSYGDDLATEFGGNVRRQLDDEAWPWPDVRPEGRSVASGSWRIAGRRGRYHAAGIGGGITGRGANLLLIDDPIKELKQADSAAYRENIYQWYKGVAYTRLENELTPSEEGGVRRKAAVVLVMTRWHDDDLAARLLKEARESPEADQWEVIRFPALAESADTEWNGAPVGPDPLDRAAGECLWAARMNTPELVELRDKTPDRIWNALYQQRPSRAGGTLFKTEWMRTRYSLRVLPVYRRIIQVCDSAWATGVENSFSVIATWGRTDTSYDLLDVYRKRVSYTDLLLALRDNWWKWRPYGLDALYIEKAASGLAAIEELEKGEGDARPPITAIAFDVAGIQQFSFVETATPYFRSSRVRLPEGAPWLADWLREHVGYPTEPNDDCPVTTAMAIRILSGEEPSRSMVSLEGFGRAAPPPPPKRSVPVGDYAGFGRR